MATKRSQRTYDHRLILLVQQTGDATIATRLRAPRSTVAGWLRRSLRVVSAARTGDEAVAVLRVRVARLERRCQRLAAGLRVAFVLLRTLKPHLSRLRVAELDKTRLLRAVARTREVLGLRRVLSILGLSPSRLSAWRRAARACELADEPSCPGSSPQRLTPDEVSKVREMVTSPDLRHVPTGRLAILAQRVGAVMASASTWHRLVRERGWRRPRLRVHPEQPKVGNHPPERREVGARQPPRPPRARGTRAARAGDVPPHPQRSPPGRRAHGRGDPGAARCHARSSTLTAAGSSQTIRSSSPAHSANAARASSSGRFGM